MAENENVPQESTQEPQGTEQVDWEAKFKEAVAQSRKWEERAKANKDKADKWDAHDAAEEANKSELQRAVERAEALKAELDGIKAEQARQALIAQVAKDSGVDAELLAAMRGSTEDEIKAHADLLKAKFAAVPGYKADPHDQGGAHPAPQKREIPIIF